MRFVALAGLIVLAGCQSMGRYPGQSDVSCLHDQMGPPAYYTFTAARSICQKFTQGQAFTGYGAQPIPFDLRGAPDLQADARSEGVPYTD